MSDGYYSKQSAYPDAGTPLQFPPARRGDALLEKPEQERGLRRMVIMGLGIRFYVEADPAILSRLSAV